MQYQWTTNVLVSLDSTWSQDIHINVSILFGTDKETFKKKVAIYFITMSKGNKEDTMHSTHRGFP